MGAARIQRHQGGEGTAQGIIAACNGCKPSVRRASPLDHRKTTTAGKIFHVKNNKRHLSIKLLHYTFFLFLLILFQIGSPENVQDVILISQFCIIYYLWNKLL